MKGRAEFVQLSHSFVSPLNIFFSSRNRYVYEKKQKKSIPLLKDISATAGINSLCCEWLNYEGSQKAEEIRPFHVATRKSLPEREADMVCQSQRGGSNRKSQSVKWESPIWVHQTSHSKSGHFIGTVRAVFSALTSQPQFTTRQVQRLLEIIGYPAYSERVF